MPVMKVSLEEPAWPELGETPERIIDLTGDNAPPIQIAGLLDGTQGGNPTVAFRLDLPDGRVVVTETTLKLFQMAHAALLGRFGFVL